jgi:hypothetical protein
MVSQSKFQAFQNSVNQEIARVVTLSLEQHAAAVDTRIEDAIRPLTEQTTGLRIAIETTQQQQRTTQQQFQELMQANQALVEQMGALLRGQTQALPQAAVVTATPAEVLAVSVVNQSTALTQKRFCADGCWAVVQPESRCHLCAANIAPTCSTEQGRVVCADCTLGEAEREGSSDIPSMHNVEMQRRGNRQRNTKAGYREGLRHLLGSRSELIDVRRPKSTPSKYK